jgi:hypothetical protein
MTSASVPAHSEELALAYVVARTLEVTVIAVGAIAMFLLVPLSWSIAPGGDIDPTSADAIAETLRTASDWTGYLGAQMIFSLSALILNRAFPRTGLVPRWLAVWGLAGVPLMFLSGLLPMFESLDSNASVNLLVVPLAAQEMVMAVWMIEKGFRETSPSSRTSETSPAATRSPPHQR